MIVYSLPKRAYKTLLLRFIFLFHIKAPIGIACSVGALYLFLWGNFRNIGAVFPETKVGMCRAKDRLSKTVGSDTTRFFVHNKKILRSVDSKYDIWYHYGVNGVIGLTVLNINKHETNHYVFRKNAQGDVTHIYRLDSGRLTLEAEYIYDAWGNFFVLPSFFENDTIGHINPIRYRGYYYDKETGLYYLNARYYDPGTGRFISADDAAYLDPNNVNGLNLYAYCGNNPVMNVDPSGRFSLTPLVVIVGVAFGTLMGGVFGGLSEKIDGGEFIDGFWGGIVNGFISTLGIATGILLSPMITPTGGAIISGFFGTLGGVLGGIVTEASKTGGDIKNDYWKNEFWPKVVPSALLNGVTNALSFGLVKVTGGIDLKASKLSRFIDGLKFGGTAFSSQIIIGFPMFAINSLIMAIIDLLQRKED